MIAYLDFLKKKATMAPPIGINIQSDDIHPKLYDFQKAIVQWALRKGRAAVFADCGLGKTFIQLEWARLIGKRALIVTPLCVAKQTIEEAKKLDLTVLFVRNQEQASDGLNITNYEMISNFDANFDAIVLDESSILKSLAGKTRKKLIELFEDVPFKLCCTATPCPNDIAELGNHAEFLGILTHPEMLATFFVNKIDKGMGWVMKGHAHDAFYKWLASWAVCLTCPEDLGFDGSKFLLPELNINHVSIVSSYRSEGELFFTGMKGIQDREVIRKSTVDARIKAVAEMVQNSNGNQWICWCGLNDEANKLAAMIGDSAVNVQGSDSLEVKEKSIWDFLNGKKKVLVTKPKIAGFGMNFQNACNTAFVGLSDSYETYYQCIRRLWRFGQKRKVTAHIVLTDVEQDIYKNVKRKEMEARKLSTELVKNIEEFERVEIRGDVPDIIGSDTQKYENKNWTLYQGDCVNVSDMLPENSIDFSVYSPPFVSLYTYTASVRDMGNSKSWGEFFQQYRYLVNNLLRITKPGRNTAVHVSQVPAMLIRDGYIGLKDFRGEVCRAYQDAGWIYHGEIVIQKNPQAQAVRTKSKALLFVQMKRDSSWLRPGLADYILLFRKPGENRVPILPEDISNEDWIRWAHPVWFDIRENKTLNKAEARTEKDEKHIAPLQLDVIDRCIRLWSNPGEVVFSPFAGIGSEGYQALKRKRKFIGAELKPEYAKVAIKNLKRAESDEQGVLF
jgi:DNA modification methylase